MIEIGLAPDWHRIGIGLPPDLYQIGLEWVHLATIWSRFFFARLAQDWHRIGMYWQCIGNVLASDWLIGRGLIFGWHFSDRVDSGSGNRLLDKGRHWIGIG